MENVTQHAVTFTRVGPGEFESFLNGQPTKWCICNGSLGLSGRGRNIYLVYDRSRTDAVPSKIMGSLHMCKQAVTQILTRNRPVVDIVADGIKAKGVQQ